MHMADALLSPAVGGVMWVATAGTIGLCSHRVKRALDDSHIPLMGVLGAFIFAAQMVNFTIPGTGSSGHLGGGMILAILLGPAAAFLVMASVLTVQALFFADGGLLALGCNIFNLGFFPCFIAFPLIYRPLAGNFPTPRRVLVAALASAVVGLQLGASSVVLETGLSGISDLPFGSFLFLMQPIHLAIGVIEGLVTATVIGFIGKARPELLQVTISPETSGRVSYKWILAGLLVAAVTTGGVLSWFASPYPDGLEWAMGQVAGGVREHSTEGGVHGFLEGLQRRTAVFPGYAVRESADPPLSRDGKAWPAVDPGTSLSGLIGGGITLLIGLGIGALLLRRRPVTPPAG